MAVPMELAKNLSADSRHTTSESISTCASSADSHGIYAVCTSVSGLRVLLLDSKSGKWINKIANESYKDVCYAAAFGTVIYLFTEKKVISLDMKTLKWDVVSSSYHNLSCSGFVTHDCRCYFFGGDGDMFNKVRCFDPRLSSWLKIHEMFQQKCASAASLSGYIYITGGYLISNKSSALSRCIQYNPLVNGISHKPPMLCGRYNHACSSLNGKIYVFGGFGDKLALNSAEVYDPERETWSFISSMNVPRWGLSLIPKDGKVFAAGKQQRDSKYTVDVQVYNPEPNQWESGVPIPGGDSSFEVLLFNAPILSEGDRKDDP